MKPDYRKWLDESKEEHTEEKERVWKLAQNRLLKHLCEELEFDLDELLDSRYGAVGSNAVLVAYISTLQNEYKQKRRYLEDKKDLTILK